MRGIFASFAGVLLLAGCATDEVVLRPLPAAAEPSTEVTVIRPRATIQAEWPFYIVVANQPVFDLRNGENTRFRMSSGRQVYSTSTLRLTSGTGLAENFSVLSGYV